MPQIDLNPKLILSNIKELLDIGVSNRHHSFHTPVFSNISINNSVESRVVVLREFNKDKLKIIFHTDFRSPKITDLKQNKKTSFLFYDSKIKTQLRIDTFSIINHKNEITEKSWIKTSLSSRKCYLTNKAPSSKTAQPEDGISNHLKGIDPSKEESQNGYLNFAVIENIIEKIDWLHLSHEGHRRLKIKFKNKDPKFDWIIP